MSDTQIFTKTNKPSNHKKMLIAFLAVDVVLIGLIALAFNYNPTNSEVASIAVNNSAMSPASTNPTVNSIITVEGKPTITGNAPANSKVKVGLGGVYYDTNSNADGTWQVITNKALGIGTYDARLEVYGNDDSLIATDSTTDEIKIIASSSIAASNDLGIFSTSSQTLYNNRGDSNVLINASVTPSSATSSVTPSSAAVIAPVSSMNTATNLARTGGIDFKILILIVSFAAFNIISLLSIKKGYKKANLD